MKKVLSRIESAIIILLYWPILYGRFKNDIWRLYLSYKRYPAQWKKIVWNSYMIRHAASISIDAQITLPLVLPHGVSGIFISQSAVIGKNCVIFQQVTVGANTIKGSKTYGAPVIGENVYIGAGAKIIGAVIVGNNCRLGANATVVQDVPPNALVVCEKPRVIIKTSTNDNRFNPYLS